MPFDPKHFITLVADNPEQIRKQDVDRLFSQCEASKRRDLAKYLSQVRPDLDAEVAAVRTDLGYSKISIRAFVRGGLITAIYLDCPGQDFDVDLEVFDFDNLEESDDAAEEAEAAEKASEECDEFWSEIY